MDILIATNNQNKVHEYHQLFNNLPIKVYSLKDLNLVTDPEETGKNFNENALIKARAAKKLTNMIVISDDSGLSIKALDGFPGIYSARFMDGHTYHEKCMELIHRLSNFDDRSATFHCSICLIDKNNVEHLFVGEAKGKIGFEEKGTNGFGYDPIFIPEGYDITFAEMEENKKNSISHRGIATKKLMEFLKSLCHEI